MAPFASFREHLRRLHRLAPLLLLCGVAHAKSPEPVLRIDLRTLGYQDFPATMLDSGAALLTTHYIDEQHLLVTFSRRRLLPRIPDDPPDDLDRNLDALLVELPTGKVLARAYWRAHDIGQYLWTLGDGSFLLRLQDRLVTISPLRHLAEGKAFAEEPLLSSQRPIGAVFVSADGRLLTLETLNRRPGVPERSPSPRTRAYADAAAEADESKSDPDPVQVNFYRLGRREGTGQPFAQTAGTVRSPSLILVPADGTGLIATIDQGHHHYAFDYVQHTGKRDELSPFDSTCRPAPILVSRSEFIALGCRAGTQLQLVGGFNLRGEEMWEQVLPEPYVNPAFSFASAGGRFAFSRVQTSTLLEDSHVDGLSRNLGVYPSANAPASALIHSQTVDVFQMESGRLLLSLTCAPVLRAGGNFALRPDGAELALVRSGNLEIYRLPPPSGKEQKAMAMATAMAPAPNEAPIRLGGRRETALPTTAAEQQAAEAAGVAPPETTGGSAAGATPAARADTAQPATMTSAASEEPSGSGEVVALKGRRPAAETPDAQTSSAQGDVEPGRRAAPTLYGPGEKPGGQPAAAPEPK